MPRVRIGLAPPDREALNVEIARLRDLDVKALRVQWHNVLGRPAPLHLPRHLLFRMVAYRLQAERFGDLDPQSKRALDGTEAPEKAGQNAAAPHAERLTELKTGTILGREWNGRMHRVSVLANGFAYEGKTYSSLSKIAFAITSTRWNGPRFFGLRDKASARASAR
jgi:Protein of unknown function (DUF2924)